MEKINLKQKVYNDLEQALKDCVTLHAFRSNGGSRVIRLEKDGEILTSDEYPHFADNVAYVESKFGIINKGQLQDDKVIEVPHLPYISPILQKIINCFVLCGESIEIHFAKKENYFVCNAPAVFNGSLGYSGIGKDILSAMYSCINARSLFNEYTKIM